MSVTYIPSTATLANIITQTPRTILLPPASERQGRVITIKDVTGLSQINPITISTQGANTFDGASNLYTISNAYAAATFVSRNNNWLLTGTTAPQQQAQPANIQANTISSATISSIYGTISSQFLTLSTLAAYATVSTVSFSNLVSTPYLITTFQSTVQNLGQAGYASTSLIFISSGGVALPFPRINIPQAYLQDFSTSLSTFSTAIGPAIQSGSVSTFSTLLGQGTSASISTFSTLIGPAIQQTIGVTPAQLLSTNIGLGSLLYASTSLVYISTGTRFAFPPINVPTAFAQDWSTPLSTFSTAIDPAIQSGVAISTAIQNLGTAGYVSTQTLGAAISSLSSLITQGGLASTQLISTVTGLGTAGYISSSQLTSTVTSLINITGFTIPQNLSTTVGLGTLGYASTSLVFVSIGTRFAFPPINVPVGFAQDWSTPMSTFSTALGPAIAAGGVGANINISTLLISTVEGLGSAGYISSLVPISSFISLIAFNSNASTYISTINPVYTSSLVLNFTYSFASSYTSSYLSSYDVYQSTYMSTYTSSYTTTYISSYNTLSTSSNYFSTTTFQSTVTFSSNSAGATFSTVTVTPTILYTSSYTSTLSATPSGTNYYIQYTTAQSVFTSNQTFTVPIIGTANQTIGINLYGAGGGNIGSQNQIRGGAAAAVFGNLPVTPGETLSILVGIVGGGGVGTSAGVTYSGAPGGGRTAIQRAGADIVTAGGGGGASGWDSAYVTGGAADGATPGTGANGLTITGQIASYGATPTAGGAYGGALYTGGSGNGTWAQGGLTFGNGGGGAGFYGGGGGFTNGGGAGAGGNSYLGNLQNATLFNYGGQGQNGVVYVTYAISSNLASTVTYAYTSTINVNYNSTILGYTSTVVYGSVQVNSTLNVTSTPIIGVTSTFRSSYNSTVSTNIQTQYTSTQGQILNYYSTYTSSVQSTLIGSNLALQTTSSFFCTITSNVTSSYVLNQSITAPIFQTVGSQMTSSLVGLGSFGYASTQLIFLPSAGAISLPFPSINLPAYFVQNWSTPLSTVALFTSNTSNYLLNLTSSLQAYSTGAAFISTTNGLGSAGYLSTLQLTSTIRGLGSAGYLSTQQLTSSIDGLGSAGYLSTLQLTSTVDGLGSAGYVSTAFVQQLSNYFKNGFQDWSTSASTLALFTSNTSNLAIQMISYSNYILSNAISTSLTGFTLSSQFISTGQGLTIQTLSTGQGLSIQTASTGQGLSIQAVSTGQGVSFQTVSTGQGLSLQILSTGQSLLIQGTLLPSSIVSTVLSLNYISTIQLNSTLQGLARLGYVSSSQLTSSIQGLATVGYISTSQLTSTVTSLLSTMTTLQSTTQGQGVVGVGYVSTSQLLSTTSGLTLTISTAVGQTTTLSSLGAINTLQLTSSITGLGTVGFASTSLIFISSSGTRIAFPPINIPTAYLQDWSTPLSTFSTSIGRSNAISFSTLSTTIAINYSTLFSTTVGQTFAISTLSYAFSTFSTTGQTIANTQLTSTVIGLGNVGYVSASYVYVSSIRGGFAFPPINIPVAFAQDWSTPLTNLQNVVNSLTNNLVDLTNTTLGFSNTIGQQISSFSTSLNIAPYINTAIQGLTYTSTTVYVNQSISTLSTLLGPAISTGSASQGGLVTTQLTSTFTGLGTGGYVSTSLIFISSGSSFAFPPINVPVSFAQNWSTPFSTLTSTLALISSSLQSLPYVSSPSLVSTLVGLGNSGYVSTSQLTSTIQGLGSAGYASTSYVNQSISTLSTLLSPAISLGPSGASIQQLTSTTQGLGSAGYASTKIVFLSNLSSVNTLPFPNLVFNSIFSLNVLNSTITTNQTISATFIGAYFFYTTTTPNLTIALPPPALAGNGWNISIQNTASSSQFITVLTTPSKQVNPGQTTRFLTDGISYYFI
jgi:hypothetical protein